MDETLVGKCRRLCPTGVRPSAEEGVALIAEIDRLERELAAANAAHRDMARGLAEMGTEVERLKNDLAELNNILSRPCEQSAGDGE